MVLSNAHWRSAADVRCCGVIDSATMPCSSSRPRPASAARLAAALAPYTVPHSPTRESCRSSASCSALEKYCVRVAVCGASRSHSRTKVSDQASNDAGDELDSVEGAVRPHAAAAQAMSNRARNRVGIVALHAHSGFQLAVDGVHEL